MRARVLGIPRGPSKWYANKVGMGLLARVGMRLLAGVAVVLCGFTPIALAQSPAALLGQAERDMTVGQYSRAEAELLRALRRRSPRRISLVLAGGHSGTTQED